MSRIAGCFRRLKTEGRKALIPYVTAGDPRPSVTVPLMHAMAAAGADVIELGIPFSDPMADGPVIQRASERALAHRMTLRGVLDTVAAFRRDDDSTPIVLMGYLNPIEVMGYEAFARAAGGAGVDGVLTVDLPPEESEDLVTALKAESIDPIFLVAPNTAGSRLETICAGGRGFIYHVSLKGVTGAANLDLASVSDRVAGIRACTDLPVAVGFGIKDAASAARVAALADGVVIGSALVRLIEEGEGAADGAVIAAVAARLGDMRAAVDAAGVKDPA